MAIFKKFKYSRAHLRRGNVIAKVVVLNKNGSIAWVEPKTNLSQALYYYDQYKDKDLAKNQTIQVVAYDNTTSLVLKQYTREV